MSDRGTSDSRTRVRSSKSSPNTEPSSSGSTKNASSRSPENDAIALTAPPPYSMRNGTPRNERPGYRKSRVYTSTAFALRENQPGRAGRPSVCWYRRRSSLRTRRSGLPPSPTFQTAMSE